MDNNARANGCTWILLAIALPLVVVTFAYLARGDTPQRKPETGTLACTDCAVAGMSANIWSDESRTALACTMPWGKSVSILRQSSVMLQVAGDCIGWVPASLVQRTSLAAATPVPTATIARRTPIPPRATATHASGEFAIPFHEPTPLPGRLSCAACARAGIPADIWEDKEMTTLACNMRWRAPVSILEESGRLLRVAGECEGWIPAEFVQK